MFPLMSTDGVLGGAWLPTDGYLDPSQLTFALADGARRGGCDVFTSTRVTGIEVEGGRVRQGRDREGRRGGRGRGDRRRHVRGGAGAARGRADPGDPDVAPVPRHAAVPR